MSRDVIVTGSSGFVGSNLCPHLTRAGFRVIPLSLREGGWRERMPREALAVIHLAGLAHDMKNTRRPEDYFAVNTRLTEELFGRFRASDIRRFIFLSSVKAVADRPGERVVLEGDEPAPGTPYGESKLKAERLLLTPDVRGKSVYILRPCMIHGPGNKGNLNLLHRLVTAGIPYPLAAFDNRRSFLSVDNLSFAIGELCGRDLAPGIYNVADSGCLSTLEVIEIMHAVVGRKPRAWRTSPALIRALAGIAGKCGLPFDEEKLYKLTESYMVSNAKLLAAIGREFPVSARDGLAMTIRSFAGKSARFPDNPM